MQLILIRHGEAGVHKQDSQRELTLRGHQQALQTARYICEHYQPDRLIVSPYVRAQQTMQAFSTQLPHTPVMTLPNITPMDDHFAAIDSIASYAEQHNAACVVVVCHMDIVARITAALTNDAFRSFALAEARVLDQVAICKGFSTQIANFIPTDC